MEEATEKERKDHMKKSKAIIVTVLVAALLLCCLACCWALQIRLPVYFVIGLFSGIGFVMAVSRFSAWLSGEKDAEESLLPPVDLSLPERPVSLSYESIRDELKEGAK